MVPAPSAPSPGLSRAAPRDQVPGHSDSSAGVKLKQTVIVELKLVRNSWLVHVIVVDIAVVRAALGQPAHAHSLRSVIGAEVLS